MAPLGLLTAVVSVIRVCGSASLRAFIGRAQESSGVAEIELLSCTSATTGELFNAGGGIARVFGSPRILEVVVTKSAGSSGSKFEVKTLLNAGEAWKRKLRAGLRKNNAEKQNLIGGIDPEDHSESLEEHDSLPRHRSPNLSLNLGIVKIDKWFTYLVAIFGIILQSGVLIFAVLTTQPRFIHLFTDPEGGPRPSYGLPFTLSGTILVCAGMFLCAYIIEKCTEEVIYERSKEHESTVYWVQPGNQKIGDQVFESFIKESSNYKTLPRYIISTRSQKKNSRPVLLMIALACSVVGFVLQFVGLRALHSSVIFAQIGVTLLMAIIRAMLRMKRSDDASNMVFRKASKAVRGHPSASSRPERIEPWIENPDSLHGHELDLLAMKICGVDMIFVGAAEDARLISGPRAAQAPPDPRLQSVSQPAGSQPGSRPGSSASGPISGSISGSGTPSEPKPCKVLAPEGASLGVDLQDMNYTLVDVRRQLAHLAQWSEFDAPSMARLLKYAIQNTMEVLSPSIKSLSGKTQCVWPISTRTVTFGASGNGEMKNIDLKLINPEGTIWQADKEELEALLGLWALSIRRGNHLEVTQSRRPSEFNKQIVRLLFTLEAGQSATAATEQKLASAEMWSNIWVNRKSKVIRKFQDTPGGNRQDPFYGNNWAGTHYFGYSGRQNTFPGHSLAFILEEGRESTLSSGLTVFCAQEIFCFFLEAVLRTVDGADVGGTTEIRSLVNQEDTFLLQNTIVEAIADGFSSSGIGTREEAYMCIFPALYKTGKMPSVDSVLPTIITRAETYRTQGKWSKAFELLEWLCYDTCPNLSISTSTSSDPDTKATETPTARKSRAQIALGDLCHVAIQEDDDDTIRLGFESIRRMLQSDLDPALSREYGWIGLRVCEDRGSKFDNYSMLLKDTCSNLEDVVAKYKIAKYRHDDTRALGYWAGQNEIAAVRYILGKGSILDIDSKNVLGYTAMHHAVSTRNTQIVQLLFRAGARIDVRDDNGSPPAAIAAEHGYDEILEMLIDYNLDAVRATSLSVNNRYDGASLLMVAAMGGHFECVKRILKAIPLSINVRRLNGDNVLAIACRYCEDNENSRAVVRYLVENGADARNKNDYDQNALHLATKYRFRGAVSIILSSGITVDIDAQDMSGATALHCAMKFATGIAKVLISYGANPNIQDNEGSTALSLAATLKLSQSDPGMSTLCNLDLNRSKYRITSYNSALAIKAAAQDSDVGMMEFLFKEFSTKSLWKVLKEIMSECDDKVLKWLGENVRWNDLANSRDPEKGLTARLESICPSNDPTITLSLDRQGYIVYYNAKTTEGETTLHLAAKFGLSWLVKDLVGAGVSVFQEDDNQRLPLHWIANFGMYHVDEAEVELLIELLGGKSEFGGKKVLEWPDANGKTPLYMAVENGGDKPAIARKLLEIGANPNGFEGGPRPLNAAYDEWKTGMADLLLEYGADVEYRIEGGATLLHRAAGRFNISINFVETLLKHKADVNSTLSNNATPLTYALSKWSQVNYVEDYGTRILLLLDHGARVTGINYFDDSPYHPDDKFGISLGNLVDKIISQRGELGRVYQNDARVARRLLVSWKQENPKKTKEDAVKELGGEIAWQKKKVWGRFETVHLDLESASDSGSEDSDFDSDSESNTS
ncbi:hypothetical protein TWF730_001103 [Orbilia blumenaviensis]|uniref:Uncharacterized protein n=1 Tax=Orbilia blumenaviensis TaxID=1796055 RepID=A0AAV9VQS6_9PEZI